MSHMIAKGIVERVFKLGFLILLLISLPHISQWLTRTLLLLQIQNCWF